MTLQGQEKPLQFDATQNLIQQLATQVKANGQMVMVVVADDDAYLEGQVTAVAEDRFSMAIFNKFNYTDVRALQVDFSDILVMEFHGLDLKLETELVRQRDHLKHVATKLYQNDGQLAGVFQNALANNRLISVVPKGTGRPVLCGSRQSGQRPGCGVESQGHGRPVWWLYFTDVTKHPKCSDGLGLFANDQLLRKMGSNPSLQPAASVEC